MEAPAGPVKNADPKKKKHASSGNKKPHKKRPHNQKGHSKSKKKGGGCCAKKKKHSKKSKKVTKKQPKAKPLAQPENEQLGNIQLVGTEKNILIGGGTPEKRLSKQLLTLDEEKKQVQSGEKKKSHSKDSEDHDLKEKDEPKKKDAKVKKPSAVQGKLKKEMEDEIDNDEKGVETGKEKKDEKPAATAAGTAAAAGPAPAEKKDSPYNSGVEKKTPKNEEKEDNVPVPAPATTKNADGSNYDKFLVLAKQIKNEDASVPEKEFDSVSCYIPPFVSKTQFTQNMSKNRFADVICIDHSRVALNDGGYIHASWVDIDKERRAIVTQLPLPNTAADFWQMIIEQKVKAVVLILTDVEYDRLGGDFVFPGKQDFLNFSEREIRVGQFNEVDVTTGWSMKVLSINNGEYKSYIHVHHFKQWAHDDVPRSIKSTWQLQSALRKYAGSPLVYMSLSGCGRAGTWAFFEKAHAHLHSQDPNFSMEKCLQQVRSGRMHSVQNVTQYSFVYTLIAEHVLGNGFNKVVNCGDEDEALQKVLKRLTIE